MSIRLLFGLLCCADYDRLERFIIRLADYAEGGFERRHYVAFNAAYLARVVEADRRDEFRDMIHPMNVNDAITARERLAREDEGQSH